MSASDIIAALDRKLPEAFGRSEVEKLMPGFIAAGTLANLDSQKKGPSCYKSRGKAIYTKESFLAWLEIWLVEGEKSDTPHEGSSHK